MSKFSNDGHKLNHQILSPCTKRSVRANLAAAHRIFCLWKTDATFCGDGILEENKDCDCENVFAMYFASRSCWRKNDIRSAMISCNVTKLSRFHCLDRLQRNLLWMNFSALRFLPNLVGTPDIRANKCSKNFSVSPFMTNIKGLFSCGQSQYRLGIERRPAFGVQNCWPNPEFSFNFFNVFEIVNNSWTELTPLSDEIERARLAQLSSQSQHPQLSNNVIVHFSINFKSDLNSNFRL